jgi:hypothetical protein
VPGDGTAVSVGKARGERGGHAGQSLDGGGSPECPRTGEWGGVRSDGVFH